MGDECIQSPLCHPHKLTSNLTATKKELLTALNRTGYVQYITTNTLHYTPLKDINKCVRLIKEKKNTKYWTHKNLGYVQNCTQYKCHKLSPSSSLKHQFWQELQRITVIKCPPHWLLLREANTVSLNLPSVKRKTNQHKCLIPQC